MNACGKRSRACPAGATAGHAHARGHLTRRTCTTLASTATTRIWCPLASAVRGSRVRGMPPRVFPLRGRPGRRAARPLRARGCSARLPLESWLNCVQRLRALTRHRHARVGQQARAGQQARLHPQQRLCARGGGGGGGGGRYGRNTPGAPARAPPQPGPRRGQAYRALPVAAGCLHAKPCAHT